MLLSFGSNGNQWGYKQKLTLGSWPGLGLYGIVNTLYSSWILTAVTLAITAVLFGKPFPESVSELM